MLCPAQILGYLCVVNLARKGACLLVGARYIVPGADTWLHLPDSPRASGRIPVEAQRFSLAVPVEARAFRPA
jgi:hypothetical protein